MLRYCCCIPGLILFGMKTPTHNLWYDALLLAQWYAVGWSREVATGQTLARKALSRDLVLWRDTDGELHCWLDLCIHRGAKLSLGVVRESSRAGAGNCLVCPYHGWEYAVSGQCVSIPAQPDLEPPAKARAETYRVVERYGAIWICLGDADGVALPEFPIAEVTGVRVLLAGAYRFRALGPRLIENFLDVAHLGIVHDGLLGEAGRSEIEDYEVAAGLSGPEADEIRIWQPNPDGTGDGAMVRYRYQVQGPLTAHFEKMADVDKGSGDLSRRFGILAQALPVDDETSEMRMLIAINYAQEIPDVELIAFQDRVAEQDRVIVESQRPELVPLDLQAELHLRSDRMAIAYRRWLREIGFSYGVA
jgi:phenylpropionate dioxygenase-like ring-hydroxylating dioxygenase large terminal subunit